MILTHESGSQEDQFDEKKWREKISWDYPFKDLYILQTPSTRQYCRLDDTQGPHPLYMKSKTIRLLLSWLWLLMKFCGV